MGPRFAGDIHSVIGSYFGLALAQHQQQQQRAAYLVSSAMSLKLRIKPQERPMFSVLTSPNDTVYQLKEEIAGEVDSSPSSTAAYMELIFHGVRLGNNKPLSHYNLTDGDTLILIHKSFGSSD